MVQGHGPAPVTVGVVVPAQDARAHVQVRVGIKRALEAAQLVVVPVPVDLHGAAIDVGHALADEALERGQGFLVVAVAQASPAHAQRPRVGQGAAAELELGLLQRDAVEQPGLDAMALARAHVGARRLLAQRRQRPGGRSAHGRAGLRRGLEIGDDRLDAQRLRRRRHRHRVDAHDLIRTVGQPVAQARLCLSGGQACDSDHAAGLQQPPALQVDHGRQQLAHRSIP